MDGRGLARNDAEVTMPGPPTSQQIAALLSAALECSFYHAPEAPGLTIEELHEVADRLDLKTGEVNDALGEVTSFYAGRQKRLLPVRGAHLIHFQWFVQPESPEYRDIKAFDFIYQSWIDGARLSGKQNVRLDRATLVERGVRDGVSRKSMEVALAILTFCEVFSETGGVLKPQNFIGEIKLPSDNLRDNQRRAAIPVRHNTAKERAYPIVADILARRHDGRPPAAEPFDAFANMLEGLGYEPFRLWWQQLVAELKYCDPQTQATSTVVLSAAVVEGALSFVVKRARDRGQGTMGSRTFDDSPTRWRIEDLLSGATTGKEDAILDETTRRRADSLAKTRQRIHAGRLLQDYPGGPPDLRPEEARDGRHVAEAVVRRVVDWLGRT